MWSRPAARPQKIQGCEGEAHDATAAAAAPIKTTLVDITKCIGCRACQVACKQWNDREGEETEFESEPGLSEPGHAQRKDAHPHHVS